MNEPTGELVELDFYFDTSNRVDEFARIVRYCCAHGGRFSGDVLQSEGPDARNFKYSSFADRFVRSLSISADELERRLQCQDIDLIKVGVWSAIGATTKVPEVVTYCGVSPDVSQLDNPAISLLSEGWVFSTPGYEHDAIKAGKRCYRRFIEICSALDPNYAAILNEDSLPCQAEIKAGRGDRCFLNFFVSERPYGAETLARIEAIFKGAYTERLPSGVYVSTSSVYNPSRVKVERTLAVEKSANVARLIRAR